MCTNLQPNCSINYHASFKLSFMSISKSYEVTKNPNLQCFESTPICVQIKHLTHEHFPCISLTIPLISTTQQHYHLTISIPTSRSTHIYMTLMTSMIKVIICPLHYNKMFKWRFNNPPTQLHSFQPHISSMSSESISSQSFRLTLPKFSRVLIFASQMV